MNNSRALFVSHGGGPMPLLGDPGHEEMRQTLKLIAQQIKKPSAIVVISAHWEAQLASIYASESHQLLYDYYGFPPAAYELSYPCSGEPKLASAIHDALSTAGIDAAFERDRGFDHGVFVPLSIMYPAADIPCIQVSLLEGLDPFSHIKLGRALQNLNYENLLILGSGFTFHNMQAFFKHPGNGQRHNENFEQWLVETCNSPTLNERQRTARLVDWKNAPGAKFCHPREEHLMPLHVCYGYAVRPAEQVYSINIMNKKSSMYLW